MEFTHQMGKEEEQEVEQVVEEEGYHVKKEDEAW